MQRLQWTLPFRPVYAIAGLFFIYFFIFGVSPASAQLTAPLTPTRMHAIQLPLSGRTTNGSVTTQQNPVNGQNQSVNTLNNNIQVQGPFGGSALKGRVSQGTFSLSLQQAVMRGIQYNLGTIEAAANVKQAEGQRLVLLSSLLPFIYGNFQLTEARISLAEAGINIKAPGLGLSLPSATKPFHYYEMRANLTQTLFDLTSFFNVRAAGENLRAARLTQKDAKELVTLAVTGTYLQAVAYTARIIAGQAQVNTAQAAFQKSLDRYRAGVNAKIDVLRSQVELQTQQQRLTTYQAQYEKQMLALERLIGLPLGQGITLSDTLTSAPLSARALKLETLMRDAMANRKDLMAARAQVRSAEEALRAAKCEYLPSGQLNANFGLAGANAHTGNDVFNVAGIVNVPVYEGGRVRGDIIQARAALEQRKAELSDTEGRIEFDVRNALLDLQTSESQISVAQSNLELAKESLQQSLDRFSAGATDMLETVQAQESFASANEDYINSLYANNLAKASLIRAVGGDGSWRTATIPTNPKGNP